uniref:Uncharacterized protein n=1 Tax=Oryza punctata TaxID=4537 RepID=A0A0E0K9H7_ORYPU
MSTLTSLACRRPHAPLGPKSPTSPGASSASYEDLRSRSEQTRGERPGLGTWLWLGQQPPAILLCQCGRAGGERRCVGGATGVPSLSACFSVSLLQALTVCLGLQ